MSNLRKRSVAAWCLYDFANSAFTTLVVTFIFSAYFAQKIASDPQHGTILWSRAVNVSAFLVALTTPFLGAIADFTGRKKLFLAASTLLCATSTAMLFFVHPGEIMRALIFFVVANVGFEAGNVFYNAFLPEVSTRETIGRVSGTGWALGYLGGLLALVIALGMIRGWLPAAGAFAVRATNLLTAVWVVIFSIPFFFLVREERRQSTAGIAEVLRAGARRIAGTTRHLRQYREAAKLLLARLVYNDGLDTVFAFASIFAAVAFGFKTEELIILGIALNVVSGLGAFVFGFVNDRIGGKRTIAISLVFLLIATAIGASAQTRTTFWIAAILLGLMIGPNQAASRSLLGLFVPEDKHAEFFGFFAFSGKLASLVGPLVYATVLGSTGSQRWAMASIGVFFLVGLVLLLFVDEKAGLEAANDGRT